MRELVATLAGVIVGWIFNEITMFFRERPKLTFKMVSTPETELIDKEYRTKTSLSEHGIVVQLSRHKFNIFIMNRYM